MLNENQLQSTMQMLSISIAQIKASMIEVSQSVHTLTEAFTQIAQRFHHLDDHCDQTVVEIDPEEFQKV